MRERLCCSLPARLLVVVNPRRDCHGANLMPLAGVSGKAGMGHNGGNHVLFAGKVFLHAAGG